MSFGEELKNLDSQRLLAILDRLYGELRDSAASETDLNDEYPPLTAVASHGFRRSKQLQARLSGANTDLPPPEVTEEEAALMDQFMKGAAVGVWALAAALKEYADLEEFEADSFPDTN